MDAIGRCALSIVIPLRDQERELPAFSRDFERASARLGESFELILVDDGSSDRTTDALQGLAAMDPRVSALVLTRAFGFEAAALAGVAHAHGARIVVLTSLRDDLFTMSSELSAPLSQGFSVVYGRRQPDLSQSLHARLGLLPQAACFAEAQPVALLQSVQFALMEFRQSAGVLPASLDALGFKASNLGRPAIGAGFRGALAGHVARAAGETNVPDLRPLVAGAAVFAFCTLSTVLAALGALLSDVNTTPFILSTWLSTLGLAVALFAWGRARLQVTAARHVGYAIAHRFAAPNEQRLLSGPDVNALVMPSVREEAESSARETRVWSDGQKDSGAIHSRLRTNTMMGIPEAPPTSVGGSVRPGQNALELDQGRAALPAAPETNPYLAAQAEHGAGEAAALRAQPLPQRSAPSASSAPSIAPPSAGRRATLYGLVAPDETPAPDVGAGVGDMDAVYTDQRR